MSVIFQGIEHEWLQDGRLVNDVQVSPEKETSNVEPKIDHPVPDKETTQLEDRRARSRRIRAQNQARKGG